MNIDQRLEYNLSTGETAYFHDGVRVSSKLYYKAYYRATRVDNVFTRFTLKGYSAYRTLQIEE